MVVDATGTGMHDVRLEPVDGWVTGWDPTWTGGYRLTCRRNVVTHAGTYTVEHPEVHGREVESESAARVYAVYAGVLRVVETVVPWPADREEQDSE